MGRRVQIGNIIGMDIGIHIGSIIVGMGRGIHTDSIIDMGIGVYLGCIIGMGKAWT
jgi:hypothetical protein